MASSSIAASLTLAAAGSGDMAFAVLLIVALGVGAQWLAWRIKRPFDPAAARVRVRRRPRHGDRHR
jgi:hypothetical protein